jgi:hypothetical protein
MNRSNKPSTNFHGPDNAEHELRKAYNCVIETGVAHFWDKRAIPGVNPHEVVTLYKHAFNSHRRGKRLASERWARAAKHLARAFWHEAKIAYLEPRATELPFLENAHDDEYNLKDSSDTTEDLLNSLAQHIPPGLTDMPEEMNRYLSRARKHLEIISAPEFHHELLKAERINAAHEYGRVLECSALAYEAESAEKSAA